MTAKPKPSTRKPPPQIIETWWRELRPQVVSPHAPDWQVADARKLFYYGVLHMHEQVAQIASGSADPRTLEENRQTLQRISDELDTFGLENFTAGNA